MEGFIVAVMRVFMWVFVIVGPIVGFIGGGLNPQARMYSGSGFNIVAALGGAVAGFIMAVLFMGVIAILLKIESNTRR
jgi:hypothetical protein